MQTVIYKPLLCWGVYPLSHFDESFFFYHNGCWILANIFSYLLIWSYDFFVLHFVYVVCYVSWFSDTEPGLHPRTKAHLIIVRDLYRVLLNSVCWCFIEDFYVDVHQGCWPIILLLVVSLSGSGVWPIILKEGCLRGQAGIQGLKWKSTLPSWEPATILEAQAALFSDQKLPTWRKSPRTRTSEWDHLPHPTPNCELNASSRATKPIPISHTAEEPTFQAQSTLRILNSKNHWSFCH